MANEYTKAVLYWIQNFNDKVKEKAKKEIWIMKLIELLNEYEGQDARYYDKDNWFCYWWWDGSNYELEIISKKFWFISWLVEQDKIDLDACEWEKTYNNLTASRDSNYTQYERILMTLAIQDNPIEFLISILN